MSEDQDIQGRAERRIGSVLHGKYRLDAILGVGGMAVVYAATHRNQKKLAVKVLHSELSLRHEIRTRFLREGYAANAVEHEGVAVILDDDVDEAGAAFLVLELLQGLDVQAWCTRHGGRLPLPAALGVTHQLLEVLAAAHEKGVIHRDIKPANLFMQQSGRLKVLDFGIARVRERAVDSEATRTGALLGTPAFMAPELASAQRDAVDTRTDLWAVGATLFRLLSGEHVHPGEHANQVLIRAATTEARSVLSVCPELPLPVAELLARALAFEPNARFQSAREMAAAVKQVHERLCGELRVEPAPSFLEAAASVSKPGTRASATRNAVGGGPTVSEQEVPSAVQGYSTRQAHSQSVEPIFLPGPALARPKRAVSLLVVAAGLLGVGLAFDWYVSRSASLLRAPSQAVAKAPASQQRAAEASLAAALPAPLERPPPPRAPAPARVAPPVIVPPQRLSAALRRSVASRSSSDHSEPVPPQSRVAKNPLDVELQ